MAFWIIYFLEFLEWGPFINIEYSKDPTLIKREINTIWPKKDMRVPLSSLIILFFPEISVPKELLDFQYNIHDHKNVKK